MRDYFVYDGVPSTDFNTFVASSNFYSSPAESVKREQVPGRNGDIFISNNRYENLKLKVMAYIPENAPENVKFLREHLMSRKNYCRYEESINQDFFRMARFIGPFEPDPIDRWRGGVELTFDCKPQMFLKTGAAFRPYYSGDSPIILYNPFEFAAQPIIYIQGQQQITVNGETINILSWPDLPDGSPMVLYIDCERKDCYAPFGDSVLNMNSIVSFSSDFPELKAGRNEITFTGGVISIAPRWWTL